MLAHVYKSLRRPDTYVYLRQREGFDVLPDALRASLGELCFALEVELTPERRLAREDPARVRANLAEHGFHLQIPPSEQSLTALLRPRE